MSAYGKHCDSAKAGGAVHPENSGDCGANERPAEGSVQSVDEGKPVRQTEDSTQLPSIFVFT